MGYPKEMEGYYYYSTSFGVYDFLSIFSCESFANCFLLSVDAKLYWCSNDEFEISRTGHAQPNTKYKRVLMDISNLMLK